MIYWRILIVHRSIQESKIQRNSIIRKFLYYVIFKVERIYKRNRSKPKKKKQYAYVIKDKMVIGKKNSLHKSK